MLRSRRCTQAYGTAEPLKPSAAVLNLLIPDAATARCLNPIRRTTKWAPSRASEARKLLEALGIRRCPRTTARAIAADGLHTASELNARNTRIFLGNSAQAGLEHARAERARCGVS